MHTFSDRSIRIGQQDLPETATITAITDGKQFVGRFDIQPDGIEFVSADEMNEAGFGTLVYVLQCLLHRGQTPECRVDPQNGFSQEDAPELYRMVPTSLCCPADAFIHDPPVSGDFHKVPDDIGRQCDVLPRINGFVHGDKDDVVVLEQQALCQLAEEGNSSEPGSQGRRMGSLEEIHLPQGPGHSSPRRR